MKKKYLSILMSVALLFFCSVSTVQALNLTDAFDVAGGDNKDPLDSMAVTAGYDTNQTQILPVIAKIINTALGLLGVIFLVLMVYGGYTWMIARGDEGEVTKAKDLILAAVIGLIIVLSSYAISYYVVDKLGSGILTEVNAPPT